MTRSKLITEGRLHEALERILCHNNIRSKTTGMLTLNKINTEAGLGNSYIHKFPSFVEYARPIIEEFNNNLADPSDLDESKISNLSGLERLKVEKKREQRLKEKYKKERDDSLIIQAKLEALNNTLMYQLWDLQSELAGQNQVTRIK